MSLHIRLDKGGNNLMKTNRIKTAGALLAGCFLLEMGCVHSELKKAAVPTRPPEDAALVQMVSHRSTLTRITTNTVPIRQDPRVATLCNVPPPSLSGHETLLTWQTGYIHVYVTTNGAAAMQEQAAVFPLGTVILKQKFPEAIGRSPELYTGMLKREAGYNPDCGDWEFFTVNGAGTAVTARGRIKSCMECHRDYAASDFVTKRYK